VNTPAIKRLITTNEAKHQLPNVYHLIDPAVSQAQRGYLYAHFGAAWVKKHHFDNKGKLPARKSK
jgi:hypothetical protein